MRRRTQFWESSMVPIYTPETLAIFEVDFYKRIYPVVLTVRDGEPYCLDILEESTEHAFIAFFKKLESKTEFFMENMNYIIGSITGIVSLITLANIVNYYWN